MTTFASPSIRIGKRQKRDTALVVAICVILTTMGCQSTQTVSPVADSKKAHRTTTLPRDADALLAAARRADPQSAATLTLDAALELLERGDIPRAEHVLGTIDRALLPRGARFRYELARARAALAGGRAEEAYTILEPMVPASEVETREHAEAFELAASESGRYEEAAQILMRVRDDADPQGRHDRIWSYLVQTSPLSIQRRASDPEESIERGWWRLALAVERAFDTSEQRAALASWQREFADHPAARVPPTALRRLTSDRHSAAHVALLLPLSGQLADAGRAVRNGFVAAFYRSGAQRDIRIYDTANQSMSALYEQAVLDGGEVIVGPLDKPNATALNALPVRIAPAVVLNSLADGEPASAGLFQFSLAIEDEGRAIADRVAEDRRRRIVLFRTDQEWANRATTAFLARWPDARDAIASEGVIYDVRSLTETIARALLIDESNERARALSSLLGERVEFVPRRRQDVDAVIAFVDGLEARALIPGLAYYFAGDVPVYTSSQAVQGLDQNGLSELDGARVCQIPWKVGTDSLRGEIEAAFSDSRGVLGSLYAFGVDAYRIVDRLEILATEPHARILGATGVLTLGPDGRVRRDPAWAIVRSGRLDALPMLIDAIRP